MKGAMRPPRLEPPPAQPMITSGFTPILSKAALASRPMTLWCSIMHQPFPPLASEAGLCYTAE